MGRAVETEREVARKEFLEREGVILTAQRAAQLLGITTRRLYALQDPPPRLELSHKTKAYFASEFFDWLWEKKSALVW